MPMNLYHTNRRKRFGSHAWAEKLGEISNRYLKHWCCAVIKMASRMRYSGDREVNLKKLPKIQSKKMLILLQ